MSLAIAVRMFGTSFKLPLARAVHAATAAAANSVPPSPSSLATSQGKASLDQLMAIEKVINEHAPMFFSRPHPFILYTKDIIFINNTRKPPTQTVGVTSYVIRLSLVRLYYSIKFTRAELKILNIVKHPEESFIKLRWRFVTRPGMLHLLFNIRNVTTLTTTWDFDAISTFHVNKDGLIYCHICDNVEAQYDELDELSKKSIKAPFIERGSLPV